MIYDKKRHDSATVSAAVCILSIVLFFISIIVSVFYIDTVNTSIKENIGNSDNYSIVTVKEDDLERKYIEGTVYFPKKYLDSCIVVFSFLDEDLTVIKQLSQTIYATQGVSKYELSLDVTGIEFSDYRVAVECNK